MRIPYINHTKERERLTERERERERENFFALGHFCFKAVNFENFSGVFFGFQSLGHVREREREREESIKNAEQEATPEEGG